MAITDAAAFETGTDAFNAHDLDGLSRVLADDCVFRAPGGIEGVGRSACIEIYSRWFEDFPDARLNVDTAHNVDDVAIELGTFFGRHDGVGRTGRSVALDYVQVLRLRDDKYVSVDLMFDRLLMLEQLGLAPDEE